LYSGDDVLSEEPSIDVEQLERSRTATSRQWLFRWRVCNQTESAMRLVSVRVPHGKFKAEECKFLPPGEIAAKARFVFAAAITCEEPPNTTIENAFLILLLDWQESHWRLFVRLRINVNQKGEPDSATESITVQRVGFSGITNWRAHAMTRKEQDLYILRRMRGWYSNWSLSFEETTGMVSNSLKIDQQEIMDALARLRREQADNPEYQKLRRDLPKDWPV
jgi:hypothetical protein